MTGSVNVGGIAGGSYLGSTIEGCHSTAAVSGISSVGGVVGNLGNGCSLMACYSTGNVTATITDGYANAGGVVGYNGGGTLTACYATGSVTGSGSGTIYVGGVTGSNNLGILTACYHAKGTVSGPGGATGGVAGRNFKDSMFGGGIITACYWGDNGQTQGIGEDQVGTGGTTQVTDGDWTAAMNAMNTALQNAGWQYVTGSGDAPLTLRKQ